MVGGKSRNVPAIDEGSGLCIPIGIVATSICTLRQTLDVLSGVDAGRKGQWWGLVRLKLSSLETQEQRREFHTSGSRRENLSMYDE